MTQKRNTPARRRKIGNRAKLRRVNINQNPNREIRPRLSVHRTNKQIYAQIIDDVKGVTLAAASTLDKDLGCEGRSFCRCGGQGWKIDCRARQESRCFQGSV